MNPLIAVAAALVVSIAAFVWAFDWVDKYAKACEARGGVTVKTSVYTIDCFDLKALRR